MNIVFEKVIAHNFLSYEDFGLSFPKLGFVQIVGKNNKDLAKSNGAGKSAIFESISYALTGETIRGVKDVTRHGTSESFVELYAVIDNCKYKVVRSKNGSSSDLKLFVDGEDKSGKGIRDTQKILSDLLPDLTSELIGSIMILGQGLPYRFTNNTPAGRKEVLEKLTKSDFMIEDIKSRIDSRESHLAERVKELQNSISILSAKRESLSDEKNRIESMLADSENIEKSEKLLQNLIEKSLSCEKEIAELEKSEKLAKENYDQVSKDLDTLSRNFTKKQFQIREIYTKKQVSIVSQKNSADFALKSKLAELKKLSSVTDICPTCGQKLAGVKLPSLDPIKKEIADLEQELADIETILDNENEEFESELKILEKDFESEKADYQAMKDDSELVYCDTSSYVREKRAELSDINSQKSFLQAKVETWKENWKSGQKRLEEVGKADKQAEEQIAKDTSLLAENQQRLSAIQKMKSYTKRDFRGFLLRNVISYLSNIIDKYSQIVYNDKQLQIKLDGNNLLVSYGGLLYEQLSGGERQKIDIIVQLALKQMLSSLYGYSCNICCMDEIFDNLDSIGCEKILELISKELADIEDVFIITHHEDLQLPCDRVLTVVKDEEGVSRIV